MQKLTIYLPFLLSFNFLSAQPISVPSTIREATVYRQGAKVTSVATVRLVAGQNEVVFEKLPAGANPASLQVRLTGGAELLAASFRQRSEEIASIDDKRLLALRDSLDLLADQAARLESDRLLLTEEEKLIREAQARAGAGEHKTLTLQELKELAAWYRTRDGEIKNALLELDKQKRTLQRVTQSTTTRFQTLSRRETVTSGEVLLQLTSATAATTEVAVTYLVYDAGWKPRYDVRAKSPGAPLTLVYKAAVWQNSGYDWADVKLHLSTAQPLTDNSRPVLHPWYINYQIVAYQERRDEDSRKLDVARNYQMNMAQDVIADGEIGALVAEPTGYEVADEFIVDRPQRVAHGTGEQIMRYREEQVPAVYEYHAVPRLDPGVFLLAKIADYGRYDLLPGLVQIFYEDTYVGQSHLDPRTVSDTLLISLGRDEDITIKRRKPTDVTYTPRFIGNNKKETITYELILKNNKPVPVSIEILDQIPISRQADIVVELEEKGGAEYNESLGRLRWRLTLAPNKGDVRRFSYTLKYPKDKTVQ